MGLLFRNQVHNNLFAQFCPNFLMLRNCFKSASQSFYGYFPNSRTAFLWKRSHGFFSDQWERSYDNVLFTNQWERSYDIVFLPTNEMEAMILFFYQPIWKKNSHCAVQGKSRPRRALQNNLFNSHSVSVVAIIILVVRIFNII